MLASSVAPVLAAEEVSVTEVQKGNLISDLTDKLWDAPVFSADSRVGEVNSTSLVGKSVYALQIGDDLELITLDKDGMLKSDLQEDLQNLIKDLSAGTEIKLVDLGYRTVKEQKNGKEVELVLSTEKTSKYTEAELANTSGVKAELDAEIANAPTNFGLLMNVTNHGYVSGKGYVINLNVNLDGDNKNDQLVLIPGMERLDFSKYLDSNGHPQPIKNDSAIATNFKGFAEKGEINTDIADKVETTYKIATDGTTLALSDIFDGVMLTEKGYALLNAAKETEYVVKAKSDASAISGKKEHIVRASKGNNTLSTVINGLKADKNGVYTVTVQIANSNKVAENIAKNKADKKTVQWDDVENYMYDTYYITGTSKAQLTKVLGWIDALEADVEEIAGENRYATAVKIAKELAGLKEVAGSKNIVLVNGNSLVDGLAAAPLAEHLGAGVTPILLTEDDKLPTATKKYLSELVDAAHNNQVTVNIVGGDAVVSKNVEKELKELNLKVKRFGGANREKTSMAVAEEIGFDNGAFVVGAEGEADAMSIAGKAAEMKAPIVVSGFKGLSDDTLYELEGQRVTVIGGEKAVSAEDYSAIKDVALTLGRVYGSNRKETNAEVIRRYYNANFANTEAVVVAKDNVLIDALTAANLASEQNAPIVLATNSLSSAQVNALELKAKSANNVYQVGYGVDPTNVVKVVAQRLGLAK